MKRQKPITDSEVAYTPYVLWALALLVAFFYLVTLITPHINRDSNDYHNPDYLKYKERVSSCNTSFYGGAKVPDKEPTVYAAWKSHMPIGC